jgi:hypothetical protein
MQERTPGDEDPVARLHEAGGTAQVVDRGVKAFGCLGEQDGSVVSSNAPRAACP